MKQFAVIFFILFTINNIHSLSTDSPYSGWLVTETEHFKIIYEEISTDSVIEIIDFCEEVYKSVTSFFNSYPDKIILVIHDRIDVSNGSYYPAPPHINMYISSPPNPEFGAKVDNWLRFLLIHELTHYVNMTIENGLFYSISRVLGESITSIPGGLMPGWAIEGIAVKLESDLTGGGRGNNPFFEMYSKALILEDKLFSFRQAAYSSSHPPLSRIYVAGYILNDYLARNYGNDIFVRIYKEYLKFPLLGFNYYVKKITNDPASKIFNNMELELKEKYFTISENPNNLLSPDLESNYFLPVITEKGWIVYRDSENEESAIVLINPLTRKETVLIKVALSDYSSFSASADGNLIFFTSLDIKGNHPAGISAVSDLYVFNSTTWRIKKITSNAHIRQPAVSENGKRLIAVQKQGQYTRLVDINPDTGSVRVLFNQENTYVFNPCFSPDGKQIIFTVQNDHGRNLYLLDTENNLKTFNSAIIKDVYNPTFIDNGNIVFVTDMEGTPDLYEIDMLKENNITKILTDPVGIFEGTISNNEIIYSTYSSNGYTLKSSPYADNNINKNFLDTFFISDINNTVTKNLLNQNKTISNYNKYIDLPKLVAYTPIPFYINPIYESSQILGPGLTAYFRSYLGKSEIFTTFTLDTVTLQPGISFELTYDWGLIGLNYTLLQGYSESFDIYKSQQTTSQKLILNFPIINTSNLGSYRYLEFLSGVINNFSLVSKKDFAFFSAPPDSGTEYLYSSYLINGIAFTYSGQKSRGDTIQPFSISSSTYFYTPISSDFLNSYAVRNTNSINIPSFLDHQVLKFSGRLTYSEIANLQYLNNPRGFYLSDNSGIRLLTSAEYLFTIARPDWPILGGLSIQGISGSIHLEKLFTVDNTGIMLDENYYTGIEFILLGNYINVFESAGLGISYRIEPDSDSFNPENLGIYLFIGTDSFK